MNEAEKKTAEAGVEGATVVGKIKAVDFAAQMEEAAYQGTKRALAEGVPVQFPTNLLTADNLAHHLAVQGLAIKPAKE